MPDNEPYGNRPIGTGLPQQDSTVRDLYRKWDEENAAQEEYDAMLEERAEEKAGRRDVGGELWLVGFADGSRVTPGTEGCVCGDECEFPCWQRLGLTSRPCCPGCPPLGGDAA